MNSERFKRYAGKMVAVQLRSPVYMLSYGGTAMIDGKEQHGVVPAIFPPRKVQGPDGQEQVIPASEVGFAQILPAVLFELGEDGAVLLKTIDPATRAKLCIDVAPDEILYVTSVDQPPSQIIKP